MRTRFAGIRSETLNVVFWIGLVSGHENSNGQCPERKADIAFTDSDRSLLAICGELNHLRLLFLALDVDLDGRTGDATHTNELALNLAQLGHNVDVIVGRGAVEGAPGGRVRIYQTAGRGTSAAIAMGVRIARRRGIDTLYERRLNPKVSFVISRIARIPYFVEVNGLADAEKAIMTGRTVRFSFLRTRGRAYLLRRARKIVTVSEMLRRELAELYGIDTSRVEVVPNGVNLDFFSPRDSVLSRRKLGLPLAAPIIGFIGKLTRWQGVDIFIRVLAAASQHRSDMHGLVVGDGPERGRLEALALSLGMENSIDFVGAVPYEEVPSYVSAMDIAFALKPPMLSGSPIKVREYMACGRPVVATSGTGYDFNIIKEAGAGVLVDHRNVAEIANTVVDLIANPIVRAEMGIRGRAYAERHCSWANTAAKVAEVCTS